MKSNCKVVNSYVIGCDIGHDPDLSVIVVGKMRNGVLEIVELKRIDLRDKTIVTKRSIVENELSLTMNRFRTQKVLKGKRTDRFPLLLKETS